MKVNNEEQKINAPLKKEFNEYEIELTLKEGTSINILIRKKNDFYYYESSFNEKNLQNKFNTNDKINNIYKDIVKSIDNKEIKINENNNNLLLSLLMKDSYIELIIERSKKLLLTPKNELNQLKYHNKNKIKKKDIIIIFGFGFIIILNVILLSLVIIFYNKLKKNYNKINFLILIIII